MMMMDLMDGDRLCGLMGCVHEFEGFSGVGLGVSAVGHVWLFIWFRYRRRYLNVSVP